MTILEARNVSKTYRIGGREIPVLDQVSLAVDAGEFVVIQGASGSGKSTLLSLLSGLDKPGEGRIVIDGRDITDLSEDDLAPMRNITIGFVFQAYHLVPALTAIENVMFPAELRGDPAATEKAEALVRRVGLADRRDSFPHQLSGGEKQRIAICRALINAPAIILHLGDARLTIADTIVSEPDRAVNFFALGPRVVVAAADLDSLNLVQRGSRIRHSYRIRLSDRQAKALAHLQEHGSLTIQDFEGLCPDVNRRSLQRDLKAMVDRGLIVTEGGTHQLLYRLAQGG